MNKLTSEQLVSNLYNASRMAPITAEQHDLCRATAEEILARLSACTCKTEAPVEVAVKE